MSHGVQAVPDTHATRRILSIMFFQTLPEVSKSLCARSLVMGTLEVIGGVRVGEACGGGDGHGALANDLCIMNPLGEAPGGASETCELWLADSKTAFARYVNFVGKSHGIGIAGAEYIRALWKESGWKIDSLVEDGMQVERPDYWVVRISLLDMTDAQVAKLARAIGGAKDGDVALQAKATLVKLQQRRNAHTLGEERKYVNVAGGPRDGPQLRTAEALMRANGLHTFMDKVPGPLLSSTHGRRLSHMPLAVDSSYTHLIGALRKAWVISEAMDDPEFQTPSSIWTDWKNRSGDTTLSGVRPIDSRVRRWRILGYLKKTLMISLARIKPNVPRCSSCVTQVVRNARSVRRYQ